MDKSNIPASTVVGISPGENIHQWIDGDIVNIAQSMGVNFHFRAIGSDAENAATQLSELGAIGPFSADKSIVAHCNIDPAVDPHTNAIGAVVCASFLILFQR